MDIWRAYEVLGLPQDAVLQDVELTYAGLRKAWEAEAKEFARQLATGESTDDGNEGECRLEEIDKAFSVIREAAVMPHIKSIVTSMTEVRLGVDSICEVLDKIETTLNEIHSDFRPAFGQWINEIRRVISGHDSRMGASEILSQLHKDLNELRNPVRFAHNPFCQIRRFAEDYSDEK